MRLDLLHSIVLILAASTFVDAEDTIYDVVVYGGTSSGVAAAVQAKRMDKSTIILEPGKHLGGLTSGGLGMTDSGNKAVIGGIAREFYQRVKKHYDKASSWKHERRDSYSLYRAADDAMWTFEPHVAEMMFEQLVIERAANESLQSRPSRVKSITVECSLMRRTKAT